MVNLIDSRTKLGIHCLARTVRYACARAAMNDVDQPCDRKGHAWLDGEGLETEPIKLTAPVLHPTDRKVLNQLPKSLVKNGVKLVHGSGWMI